MIQEISYKDRLGWRQKEEELLHTFEACAGFQWGAVLHYFRPA